MILLCDVVEIIASGIRASPRADRVAKISGQIPEALQLSRLIPAAPSKLRGALGFHPTLLMETIGRGVVGPLILRQYAQRGTRPTQRLRRCLFWRYISLLALPPRTIPYLLRPPIGAHADAKILENIAAAFGSPIRKLYISITQNGFAQWTHRRNGHRHISLRVMRRNPARAHRPLVG